jgi:hypothetical protein
MHLRQRLAYRSIKSQVLHWQAQLNAHRSFVMYQRLLPAFLAYQNMARQRCGPRITPVIAK